MAISNYVIQSFGSKVRFYRLKSGMTQSSMAIRLGLHRSYLGAIERGQINISFTKLLEIAKVLEVEPCILVEDLI